MKQWLFVVFGVVAITVGASASAVIAEALRPERAVESDWPSASHWDSQAEHETNTNPVRDKSGEYQNRSGYASLPIGITEQYHGPGDPKSGSEGEWYANPNWWVAGFTGALVIVTGLLWIFTWLLWSSTRQTISDNIRAIKAAEAAAVAAEAQVTHMENAVLAAQRSADAAFAAVGSERAWIMFDGVRTSPFNNAYIGGKLVDSGQLLHINWKNVGRSPAVQVMMYREAHPVRFRADVPLFVAKWSDDASSYIFGPNLPFHTDEYAIHGASLEKFKSREIDIVLYSAVKYFDMFNKNTLRHTEACIRVTYNGIVRDESGKGPMNIEIRPVGSQKPSRVRTARPML